MEGIDPPRYLGGRCVGLRELEAASGQIMGVWQCSPEMNHQIRNTK